MTVLQLLSFCGDTMRCIWCSVTRLLIHSRPDDDGDDALGGVQGGDGDDDDLSLIHI